MENGEKMEKVLIPEGLYHKVEERCKQSGFKDVSGYIAFVLEQVIKGVEVSESKEISTEDEKHIKKKLKALGYL